MLVCDVKVVDVGVKAFEVVHALVERTRHIIQRIGVRVDDLNIDGFISNVFSFVVVS